MAAFLDICTHMKLSPSAQVGCSEEDSWTFPAKANTAFLKKMLTVDAKGLVPVTPCSTLPACSKVLLVGS